MVRVLIIIFFIGYTCIANENTVEKTVPNRSNKIRWSTEVSSRTGWNPYCELYSCTHCYAEA